MPALFRDLVYRLKRSFDRDEVLAQAKEWVALIRTSLRRPTELKAEIEQIHSQWDQEYWRRGEWPAYFTIFDPIVLAEELDHAIHDCSFAVQNYDGPQIGAIALLVRCFDLMDYVQGYRLGIFANQKERMLHIRAKTEPLAYDATLRISLMLCRAGYPMPRPLGDFLSDNNDGKRKRPKHKGRYSEHEYFRAITICDLLHRVSALGPYISRNEASEHRDTACDIVAEAFIANRLQPQSYDHLKDIWEAHQQRFLDADLKNYLSN